MSIKSFKFVSPGVFVNEVDNSQLPRLAEDMGPVIIGRAERGPGMVPVKINSFSEFVETFGEPIAGAQASDAWRQGNRQGPTYGAFAAQAYLKNGSPITFVRLLGESHPDAAAGGKAGWQMDKAWGIKVDSDGVATNGPLAAVLYTNSTTAPTVAMSGTDIKITIKKETAGTAATSASGSFTVEDTFTTANIDLTPGPARVQLTIKKALGLGGADGVIIFDDGAAVNDFTTPTLTIGTSGVADDDDAALGALIEGGINAHFSGVTANYNDVTKTLSLIKDDGEVTASPFIALSGNHDNEFFVIGTLVDGVDAVAAADGDPETFIVNFDRNSKKYIRDVLNTNPTLSNIRIATTPESHFLGASFDQHLESKLSSAINSVAVADLGAAYYSNRASASAPSTPWVRSQFMGSASDLTSALVAAQLTKLFRVHSLYTGEWEQKNFKISVVDVKGPANDFVKYGTFSVLVRDAKDNDATPVTIERFSNMNLDPTSPKYIGAVIGDMKMIWRDSEKRYVHIGEHANQSRFIRVEVAADIASGAANASLLPFAFTLPTHAALSTSTPAFVLRANTKDDKKLSSAKDACFGITTDRPDALGRFDESYQDIVRPIHGTDDMHAVDGALFSLDLIKPDGANAEFGTASLSARTSINGLFGATYESVLTAGYDSFTLPLCGGRDGLDITEIEPFCDDIMASASALSNYAYNSISKAIDIVSDPEVVECNLMTIPGVSTSGLTGKLISTCEARADALAIIDLENDYKPRGWAVEPSTGEAGRLPSVDLAVSSLKSRGLSSSYGCAFFPWVQVTDQINNRNVWMPPSVVALGTMASSAAKSELWFAPAGFTRGGLSGGAGGLPVSQVRLRLSSKERDKLYETGINPIAQFPAEGIVVFGQKTLQFTPSALDRINVRRLMIHVKKEISRMAATVLFDQNVEATWTRFTSKAEPFLASVKSRFGLTEYRIILDETTTTAELIDRNIMYAKIYLKPARAIEFIAIDFVITNTGASFDD
jgi:hypothetical protein